MGKRGPPALRERAIVGGGAGRAWQGLQVTRPSPAQVVRQRQLMQAGCYTCRKPGPQAAASAKGWSTWAAASAPTRSGLTATLPWASSASPKRSAKRAPRASARLNCDFMLPMPSAAPAGACMCTLTPAARSACKHCSTWGSAAASGTTAKASGAGKSGWAPCSLSKSSTRSTPRAQPTAGAGLPPI